MRFLPTGSGHYLIAGLMTILIGLPAIAQQERAQAPAPTPSIEELDDEKIEAVAEAYLEILPMHMMAQQELEQVDTPEQAQQIQQRANEKMLTILAQHKVTVDEYGAVMTATSEDPEFQEKFVAIIEKLEKEQSEQAEGS